MATRQLRPPGVAFSQPAPRRVLEGVRLDTCVFAGVSRRGPCRLPAGDPDTPGRIDRSVPVLVNSWDEFALRFGGLRGPGLLPSAVAAFFENGGQRAYVIRIVHDYGAAGTDAGTATSTLSGLTDTVTAAAPEVVAADEGAWGNGIAVAGVFRVRAIRHRQVAGATMTLGAGERVGLGALLRARTALGGESLHWVESSDLDPLDGITSVTLDGPAPADTVSVEEVTADLTVRLPDEGLVEHHGGLGLDPAHPRFLGTVLERDSVLLRLVGSGGRLHPDGLGVDAAVTGGEFVDGHDGYADVVPSDFFDPGWIPGNEPGAGVHSVTDHDDIGMLCIPDLYSPFPAVEDATVADPSLAGADFAECVTAVEWTQAAKPDELAGLRLDPLVDFDAIVAIQQRAVTLAEQLLGPVALLDVPPGLTESRIRTWRGHFSSSYAAAYHPWLRVPNGDRLTSTNPSAAAAGIIAMRELRDGIPTGPANEIVIGAADVSDDVDPVRHGEFHHLGLNILIRERDGVRLTGARTLSRDRSLRQLSVRRLMVLIRRSLEQRMQWVTFEPNHHLLWADLRHITRSFLRELARQGAFQGATEAESFFVRCDGSTNPPWVTDTGRVIAEIGVAPAHPMEFIEVTLAIDGDATVRAEETNG